MMQQSVTSENRGRVEGRIRGYVAQVLLYEDPHRQEAARRFVPVDELKQKAMAELANKGNHEPAKEELDHEFLLQMLVWFSQSFRWVNAPPCDSCNSETTEQGEGDADHSEALDGASVVELYCCTSCSSVTRFPRYNDPLKLLETRRGRCGEWGNCFTLCCRAFGYESRFIVDFTDHVWTECFSPYLGRWMHLDPCGGVYDYPLRYEEGWNKELNYVIAIARDGVYDVTKRYTRKWQEVLSRRDIATESALASILRDITSECRKDFSPELLLKLDERDESEAKEIDNLYSEDDVSTSI